MLLTIHYVLLTVYIFCQLVWHSIRTYSYLTWYLSGVLEDYQDISTGKFIHDTLLTRKPAFSDLFFGVMFWLVLSPMLLVVTPYSMLFVIPLAITLLVLRSIRAKNMKKMKMWQELKQ
jgi:hypothetical protein